MTVLDISTNQITEITRQIGYIRTLRELYASQNKIKDLPPELGELEKLERLVLNHNEIQYVPVELGQCHSLLQIDFSHNKINMIPPDLGRLPRIKMIKLANNPLDPELREVVVKRADKWVALQDYIISPEYDKKFFEYQRAEQADDSFEDLSEGEVGVIDD
tara:strand:- start:324 stop:806 length:483 start_codon:yes stop_codon:yes gene_type:complete